MITEDYISFETAKLLKEKGFDEYCYGYYYTSKYMTHGDIKQRNSELFPDSYSAPTLQMAMKWLREVHNIHIEIGIGYNMEYFPVCISTQTNEPIPYIAMRGKPFTYEKACEVAIKYCLENLI